MYSYSSEFKNKKIGYSQQNTQFVYGKYRDEYRYKYFETPGIVEENEL